MHSVRLRTQNTGSLCRGISRFSWNDLAENVNQVLFASHSTGFPEADYVTGGATMTLHGSFAKDSVPEQLQICPVPGKEGEVHKHRGRACGFHR